MPPHPTPAGGQTDPALLLRFCELCLRVGQPERARPFLRRLGRPPVDWTDRQLVQLLNVAERLGEYETAELGLRAALSRQCLSLDLACHMLRLASFGGDAAFAEKAARHLSEIVVRSDRCVFDIFADRLLLGPDAALARLRRRPAQRRGPIQALALAQLLLETQDRRLLLRYLRYCRRRWPEMLPFNMLLVRALDRFGEPGAALRLLDRIERDWPAADLTGARVHMLAECGDRDAALAVLEERTGSDAVRRNAAQAMRLFLLAGRVTEAEALVPSVASGMGRGKKSVSKFGTTLLGSMLTEARVLQRVTAAAPGEGAPADGPDRAELARHYFLPAARMLDAWQSRPAPANIHAASGRKGAIPRNIFQYWNTDSVPEDVTTLTASWRDRHGFQYQLLNRRAAIAFLKDRFDADHVRAFKMANHVAEECDFLRLCLLYAEGGIYADVDDKLLTGADEILALGLGAILFREAFGAVCNNILVSKPGHRVFEIAIDLARESLLARENDSTWAKTGPGLLTRAVALYLHETPDAGVAGNLTILPQHVYRQHAQLHTSLPYKSTAAYWNSKDGQAPARLLGLLADALDGAGQAAGPTMPTIS